MTLAERVNDVKMAFFRELDELLAGYDKERIMTDDTYEISAEADAKIDELLDYSEDWYDEYFHPVKFEIWKRTMEQRGVHIE